MNKREKVGLYVGKFIAYHKGHQHYINYFANQCDRLNLILCSNSKLDRVPFQIRKDWITNDMKSGGLVNVASKIRLHKSIEDNITPYPEGIKEWCNIIQTLLNEKVDVMFGNDDYVAECAPLFNAEYITPDKSRDLFNISSTQILDNKLKYYDYLADVSKPYFNQKVLITGPESTGKSTLIKKLADYFKGDYVDEYGRDYEEWTIRNQNRKCTEWSVEEYEQVAVIHNEKIKEKMKNPIRLLFIDTDAIVTEMYSEIYINKTNQNIKSLINQQTFDLILYLDHKSTHWVRDELRIFEDEREKVGSLIKNKLREYNKEFIEILNEEDYDKRFENVKNIIKTKFNIEK